MTKKLLLVLALITGSIAFKAAAQVHINVNIGVRPAWCPVGYEQAAYYICRILMLTMMYRKDSLFICKVVIGFLPASYLIVTAIMICTAVIK